MKITTKIVWDMETGKVLEHRYFTYEGPLDLADRAAQSADKTNAATAGQLGSTLGAGASTEHSTLSPFYTNEMKAEHSLDPSQTGELLTAAEAGSGGATGALTGQAQLEAARTRNPSGFTKALDEASRDQSKTMAGTSEGVAAEDIMGAQKLRQEGAAGEQGLYGEDLKGQLAAMGQQTADVSAGVDAGKSGWLQNMDQTISALGSAATGAGAMGVKIPGCWIAAAVYGGWDNPRVDIVRQFIFNDWAKRSLIGKLVARAYMKFGERIAEHVKKNPMLKALFRNLLDKIN